MTQVDSIRVISSNNVGYQMETLPRQIAWQYFDDRITEDGLKFRKNIDFCSHARLY